MDVRTGPRGVAGAIGWGQGAPESAAAGGHRNSPSGLAWTSTLQAKEASPIEPTRWPTRWRFQVTARDIRRFAQAIGEPEPPRVQVDGAWDEPVGLQAPPLFCQAMAWQDWPANELGADGAPREFQAGPAGARAMGGASDFTVHRPVRAGEVIEVASRVAGVQERQGRSGPLHLVTVETAFTDAAGLPVAFERATFVKREAVAP